MTSDYRMLLFLTLGGGAIVYGVFWFPALTTVDYGSGAALREAEYAAVFSQEMTYCLEQPDYINCQCFARVSGTIQVDDEPKVFGAIYANKQDLARGQAANSC